MYMYARAKNKAARAPRFRLGDIVLAYRRTKAASKVMARAEGPFRVVAFGRHGSYMLQRLDKKRKVEMSPYRMIRYADCEYQVTRELVYSASEGEALRIDRILDWRAAKNQKGARKPGDGIELKVRWIGYPDAQDREWRSAADLYAVAAPVVKTYLLPRAMNDALIRATMTELLGTDAMRAPPAIEMRKTDICAELRSYGLSINWAAPKATLAKQLDEERKRRDDAAV